VLYAKFAHDIPTGISIATYILTVLSLALALIAYSDSLNLTKPDGFEFKYSVKNKTIEDARNAESIMGKKAEIALNERAQRKTLRSGMEKYDRTTGR
jgi:hypothetical protein